jgi:glycosyltransferase involved in cell wall biosynthesis
MSFDAILSRVASGESVTSSELLPYLCAERRERRAEVNRLLAGAYFQSGGGEDLQRAKVFIRRAWLLSRFSPDLLPLYTQIHSALDDIPGIREAYKRLGVAAASRGDVSEAIRYFDLWQYAYMQFKSLDKFEYDFDILECVDRLARPHRLSPKPRAGLLKGGKIRVAYLVKGITELGSVLVRVNLLFARYHDRARVEPMFFVPESGRAVLDSEAGREHVRLFESHGCELRTAPDMSVMGERLRAAARMIYDARPDILVASAALTQFQHYYITSLRPAPFVIGHIQGPPQQYAPPLLDYGVVWSKHPLIDCPVSCSWVPLRGDLPERDKITPYDRRDLGVPDGAFVVASAGRYVKFQEPAFWRAVLDLLGQFPHLHYLLMGAEEAQVPFLSPMLSQGVRARVHFLSWRGDSYLRGLCLADVLIDTFPSGGGGALLDALALGIPPVSFENNYMRLYDQTDWSLADEFIKVPELIVPRGDFDQMKRVVSRLVADPEYRRDVARRCQEYVLETRTKPPLSVRECEDIYLRFLEQRLSGDAAPDAREAEILESARAPGPRRAAPRWVAGAAHQLKRALRFGVRVLDRVA